MLTFSDIQTCSECLRFAKDAVASHHYATNNRFYLVDTAFHFSKILKEFRFWTILGISCNGVMITKKPNLDYFWGEINKPCHMSMG